MPEWKMKDQPPSDLLALSCTLLRCAFTCVLPGNAASLLLSKPGTGTSVVLAVGPPHFSFKKGNQREKIIFLTKFCYLGSGFFSPGLLAQESKTNQSGEWQGDLLKPKQSHRTPARLTGHPCSFLSERDCACLCYSTWKGFLCFPFYLLSRKMVFSLLSISGCEALGMLGRALPSVPRQQWWFPSQPRALHALS